uniref:Putative asparagine synthase n=1 Tax=viral metagenome TaxID=1070528 RepID=A0A6H1ZPC0_9ZZZZ
MIVHPRNWRDVHVTPDMVWVQLLDILKDIPSCNLALSGGVDSSLLLKGLIDTDHKNIQCFTIAFKEDHPDIVHAKLIAKFYDIEHKIIIAQPGKPVYQTFYDELKFFEIEDIVCGDGVDEYMAGYYDHCKSPEYSTYYHYIDQLIPKHLNALDNESQNVKVYLPFLDDRFTGFAARIPLSSKVAYLYIRKHFIYELAKINGIPKEIIDRRKYGFCDIWKVK